MDITNGITALRRRAPSMRGGRSSLASMAIAIGAAAIAIGTTLDIAASGPLPTGEVAYAAPQAPASSGGCGTYTEPAIHVARLQSCISENRAHQIVSDMHVDLASPLHGLSGCSYTISVRDDTARNTVARQTRSGCQTAPAPVVVAAIDGHQYHTYIWETLTDGSGVHHDPHTYNSTEQTAAGQDSAITAALNLTAQLSRTQRNFWIASQLVAQIKALSSADLDQYLTMIPAGQRSGLNKGLHDYFGPSSSPNSARVDFTNSILSRASATALAAVENDLKILQPALSTGGDSAETAWVFGQRFDQLYVGSPSIQDADQGSLDDCYFHAELLSLVKRDSSWVKNRMIENPNGTVTVVFAAARVTITRDLPTKPDGTHPYGGDRYGTWIALFEKAYAQLKGGYPAIESGSLPSTWKWTGAAYQDLTGHPADRQPPVPKLSPGGVAGVVVGVLEGPVVPAVAGQSVPLATIDKWLHQKHAVVASTTRYDANNDHTYPATGTEVNCGQCSYHNALYSSHEYVVQHVDLQHAEVTLVNPWGSGHQPFQFQISAADFGKYIMDVAEVP